MKGRLPTGLLVLAAGWLTVIPLQRTPLSAQEPSARFRVMVPEIQGLDGADRKFGERLADRLRDLINDMATHQPIEERELKRALDEYEIDMEDLDCVRGRQLSALINAQVVFCGTYRPDGEGYRLDTKFLDSSGEEFPVEPITVPERGQREAAEHIFRALQLQSDQARYTRFCGEYAASQQWSEAESLCLQAIELNPAAVNSLYTLGVVFQKTDRPEEALARFERVLSMNPLHEEALQWAGNLSATLGRDDEARGYYQQYLQLNPANAGVRMRVAYDLAQAGDPFGAMEIIEEGLATDPDNVELLKQHGGFAFTAGAEVNQGQDAMTPEAEALFRKALSSFDGAYDIEGADMDVTLLANMVKAYLNLGEPHEAVSVAERIIETHGAEAVIWSFYADALKRADRLDDAHTALDRILELDPEYQNVLARKGTWLLDEGQIDAATPILHEAVARGEQSPDDVGDLVFFNGYQKGIQLEDWTHSIRVFRLAKEFEITDQVRQKVDFFLGYAVLKDAIARQEPRTKQTAEATLPLFQEARRLLQAASDYARGQGNLENDRLALLESIGTFIEIQEAIIQRGR